MEHVSVLEIPKANQANFIERTSALPLDFDGAGPYPSRYCLASLIMPASWLLVAMTVEMWTCTCESRGRRVTHRLAAARIERTLSHTFA